MKNTESSIIFKLNIAEINNPLNILSQTNIRNFRKNSSHLNVVEMDKNFSSIPTIGAAIEVICYIFRHLNSEKAIINNKTTIEIKHLLLQRLMSNFPYESYKNHELLKNYKIIRRQGFFEYILDDEYVEWILGKIIPIIPDMLTKIQMMSLAFQCSILNRNDEAAKEIFKYIIKEIDLYFNYYAKEIEQYTECTKYLLPVIKLIEPESQLKIIQALVPYIKFSLDLSVKFYDLLIKINNFEGAKALLEESNASLELTKKFTHGEEKETSDAKNLLNTNDDDEILGQYYYRLACAYDKTGDYNMSTKYYKLAFEKLPMQTEIAYSLWSNYTIQGEFEQAKNLITKVQEGCIKCFLEMLTNPYEISYKSKQFVFN